jgi:hypothetical protein
MPRLSLLLLLRGLGLALLLTLLLLHLATPRTYVTPGDQLTPAGPARQDRETAAERQRPLDGVTGQGRRAPVGDADHFGTN